MVNHKEADSRFDTALTEGFYGPVAVHNAFPAPYALSLKRAASTAHIKTPLALLFTIFPFSLFPVRFYAHHKTRRTLLCAF